MIRTREVGTGSSPNKRSKISTFYSDDEEDNPASSTSTHLSDRDYTLLKQESARLLSSRQALPIHAGQAAILSSLAQHDTIIILGETGSGKTTQLPQYILGSDTPRKEPRIVVTQPRRVAATSLATRVAAEVGCRLGDLVGYTVRFSDVSSHKTRLKYVTDGTLLAEMLSDRDLRAYDVVILDEAHERSLRTDMLMGFLKEIQQRRKEEVRAWKKAGAGGKGKGKEPTTLKVVVMSATLDAEQFSKFFDDAPILYIKGRQYDVKLLYSSAPSQDYCHGALTTILDIHVNQPPGDILVFLPGQEDIESVTAMLKTYLPDLHSSYATKDSIMICPLFAKLSAAEQAKAFLAPPPKTRKVILATNVAETSVTITGIKFVVDAGMCKEKEYHASLGIDTLSVQSISQSSARQRTGRAGRGSNGVCYRLYTESDYGDLAAVSAPEIQRVSLTFAMLQLLANGVKDLFKFPYMDPPHRDSISGALLTLHGLGAIDPTLPLTLTSVGRQMSTLPLDPAYARILLASFEEGESCPEEVINLVALLGAKDSLLYSGSVEKRDEINSARAKFVNRKGDHMMLLNVLKAYEEIVALNAGKGEAREWCQRHYIGYKAIQNVLATRSQLRERCDRMKLDWRMSTDGDEGEKEDRVLSCVLKGLFNKSAVRQKDGSYRQNIDKGIVHIHPSSSLHNKKPAAIVYDELILTAKPYARGVSEIPLRWLRDRVSQVYDNHSNENGR